MNKLWQKNGQILNEVIERYTVGDDILLDSELLPFDIQATAAHANALQSLGIFTKDELRKMQKTLAKIAGEAAAGKIVITIQDEDCHTVLERLLIEHLGETGKKIHTARSRNDQVLTAVRLYMRSKLDELKKSTMTLAEKFLQRAKEFQNVPLPGYTHTQQAMLSSVGHLYCAYAESLIDDALLLQSIRLHINKNPLGSAAGFGTTFAIDRRKIAEELGFDSVQLNSLYCQNSRGKFESVFVAGISQIMLTLGKFASDMLLFTSQEFSYFTVEDSLVTGSSIMPQKRNLDGLEILRGNVSRVIANERLIVDLQRNIISGYHRDLQLMKKPLIEACRIAGDSLTVADLYLAGCMPNKKNIDASITPEIFTADIANRIVQEESIPFRNAYQKAKDRLKITKINAEENLASKISLGAPGNLGLEVYEERLKDLR